MKSAGNNFVTKLSKTPPKTVDLPAIASTPVEIDLGGVMNAILNINVASDFIWTTAETAAVGLSRIAAVETAGYFPAGFWQFNISANHDDKFYIRSQAAGATTNGISYSFSEFG